MLESIFKPSAVQKRPWEAFLIGFLFTIAAGLLTLQIRVSSPCNTGLGLLFVAFISLPAAPLFMNLLRREEREIERGGGNIFTRHMDVIEVFAFFFFGIILASSIFYVIIPADTANYLFSDQLHDLEARGIISGAATARIGFIEILVNNLQVLFLAFVLSFVLGVGAVFLISWNASVIGALIGKIAELQSGNIVLNYFAAFPLTILRILPHGIFEFGGYFLAAIAGGILSVAILREKIAKMKKIMPVLQDAGLYLLFSIIAIVIGAAIEVLI